MINQSLFGLIIPHQILQFNNPLDFSEHNSTFYVILHNQTLYITSESCQLTQARQTITMLSH